MVIDNFDKIIPHLEFKEPTDRYIVHILRRAKDCKTLANEMGSNESQRLLKTYYIDSLDYFKRKIPAMKELANTNHARVYFFPQVKNNKQCLLSLAETIIKTVQADNYSVKPEHLLRAAYCKNHTSRKKVWMLDLDNDEMYGYTLDDVVKMVKGWIELKNKLSKKSNVDVDHEVYVVPTKNGYHIITPPFDVMMAQAECPMIFEGQKKFKIETETETENKTEVKYETRVGWLHKDPMTLLYANID